MSTDTMKKRMSKEDLAYFRQFVLKKREEVIKNVKRLEQIAVNGKDEDDSTALDSTYAYHMADVGTDAQEREKAFLWLSRENKFLTHLNAALDRIANGEYGVCIECGEIIPKERLEEVPHTQHCAKCKNKHR
jgi:RNA polymerase-binding protein DksA